MNAVAEAEQIVEQTQRPHVWVPWPLLLGAMIVIAIVREYMGGRDATAAL